MRCSNWIVVALGLCAAACSGTQATNDGGPPATDAGGDAGSAAPQVRSISPAVGPTDGGTSVRISGVNFTAGAQVKLGPNALGSAVVVSASEIDGVTPPGAAGQVDVIVLNPDSRLGSLRGGFTYLAPTAGPDIQWCNLQFPDDAGVSAGAPFSLFGRVYVSGVTDAAGQGAGVQMQAGLGASDGGWSWADATYNLDAPSSPGASDINNDEYLWSSVGPAAGRYATAFRARFDGGAWHLCELDGIHDALDPAQVGQLVSVVPPPPQVSWCDLQFPTAASGAPGSPLALYGQVFAPGVTDSAGPGVGIEMEAGIGFADGGWAWSATSYNGDRGPNGNPVANDEYLWSGTCPSAPGDYLTAFRASLDGGPWTYCLVDGPYDQIDVAKAGTLSVAVAAPPTVSWCNLQFPTELQAQPDAGLTVYGRVYQPGVTDLEGAGPGIAMQVGLSGGDGGWVWRGGTFHSDEDGLNVGDHANDEYEASFNAPGAGNYQMAFRASLDGGPWTFCEVDGPHGSYAPLAAAPLTVGDTVGWCNLQFPAYPPDAQLPSGAPATFYGRVYQAGVTDQAGQGAGIEMQFGFGPGDGGWSWTSATYNGDKDGLSPNANDEYKAGLTTPPAGSYFTLYRARLTGGPWLYCEPNGPHLGVDLADAGVMVTW